MRHAAMDCWGRKYNEDEPRDDHGRWTDGGGGGGSLGGGTGGGGGGSGSDTSATGAESRPATALAQASEASDPLPTTPAGVSALGAQIASDHGATEALSVAKGKLAALNGYSTDGPVANGGFMQPDGTYTPERAALHRSMINKLFSDANVAAATPDAGTAPTMTVLGGRGGSGKSWFTKKGGPVDTSHAILIDADGFKAALPEYQGWNAAALHEESDHLVNMAATEAVALKVNVIHDATLRSFSGVSARVANYQAAGFQVQGYYMYTAPQVATGRAMQRFVHGGPTGRFVPPEVILGNTQNERNFDQLIPHFSKWAVYDNNGASPVHVASGGG